MRPSINHGFLRDPADRARLARGLEAIGPTLAELPLGPELTPRPAEGIRAWLDHQHHHYWHLVGTCAIGDDPGSVVDNLGGVRGIENLQVADAAVFPTVRRATTALPVVLVGERIASSPASRSNEATTDQLSDPAGILIQEVCVASAFWNSSPYTTT